MSDSTPYFFRCSKFLKCTLFVTDKCNLDCSYCYVCKKNSSMSIETAKKIVDYILLNSPKDEEIQFGFFGGEPLLEFDLIKEITKLIKTHKNFRQYQSRISLATNGTVFSKEIADFLIENDIAVAISCDGPSEIQDLNRKFIDGAKSSKIVESNIKKAVRSFPSFQVTAVYSPDTIEYLPLVVEYLSGLGVKRISLSHNVLAKWTKKEADMLAEIYGLIGRQFIDSYLVKNPLYINLIDSKIAAILRGGYTVFEKCRMGTGELAFSTEGKIYPCERLAGSINPDEHWIGYVKDSVNIQMKSQEISTSARNSECLDCGIKKYCVNWCGCSNFFATGCYERVGPFVCASEKAAIKVAYEIIREIKDTSVFCHHLNGTPLMNAF